MDNASLAVAWLRPQGVDRTDSDPRPEGAIVLPFGPTPRGRVQVSQSPGSAARCSSGAPTCVAATSLRRPVKELGACP